MTFIISWGQYVFPLNLFQPPGNSLRAIDLAFASGYDGMELDVQMSKTDELVTPPELTTAIMDQADGLDGVLLPLVGFPDELLEFRLETRARNLKLAVYMHKTGADDLYRLMEIGVDYVTSYSPTGIGAAKRRWNETRAVADSTINSIQ